MKAKINNLLACLCALALLPLLYGCRENCNEVTDLQASGLLLSESPSCNYVRAESLFEVSYLLPVGDDNGEEFTYTYTANNGFSLEGDGVTNGKYIRAPKAGTGQICLTVSSTCHESNTVCIDITAIDTDLIHYRIHTANEPDRDANEFLAYGGQFADNGYVYSVGGFNATGSSTLPVLRFDPDPTVERWEKVGDTPNGTSFTEVTAVKDGSTVYLFTIDRVYHLSLPDLTFTEGPAYPNNEQYSVHFAALHNGWVYTAPRASQIGTTGLFYRYNPATMQWEALANLPHSDGPGKFAQVINGQLLVGGGVYGSTNNVTWLPGTYWWYNPGTDSWTQSYAQTKGDHSSENVTLGGFEVGGTVFNATVQTLHYYDAASDDFIKMETSHPDWPACFNPQFMIEGRPRGFGFTPVDEKVVISGYSPVSGGGAANSTAILHLN